MDGKLIYILIIIAYGIYSSYSKSKKEAEKKKLHEEKKMNNSGSPDAAVVNEKPKEEINSWEDLIRSIKKETTMKKQVVKPQTTSQQSQAAYNKKKKAVQEKVFVQMKADESAIDELKIDVMKGIPDEGIPTTAAINTNLNESEAYLIVKEEESSYKLNAREAFIQSVIITRPEY